MQGGTMAAEYVRIHYSGDVETVPLRDRDELPEILRTRGHYASYEIRQAWWYRPAMWLHIQRSALLPPRH